MGAPRYDVLDIRYASGQPAVLRHVDGSGFAYYPSGRKAICVSAHGCDGQGKTRRFGAIVHNDTQRSAVIAVFDDWGHGYADGQQNAGEAHAPKVLISEKTIIVIDGSGKATEVPNGPPPATTMRPSQVAATEIALRLNNCITLNRQAGRTTIVFNSEPIYHTFMVGELQGEEVEGMLRPAQPAKSLQGPSAKQLAEATQKMRVVKESISQLKVDPSQRDTKPTFSVNTASLKDVLDNITSLAKHLAHPNLAPPDLEWGTEWRLRKLLAEAHPQCPGQDKRNWSIARVSGKCTEERLANAKPTVATPKSIAQVSQLKLPEIIAELSNKNTLLVVICLAAYAKEQSGYARLQAEKAHAELWQKFSKGGSSTPPPVRLVAVEMTEIGGGFADQHGVKEVPYCLMIQSGRVVYSKRLNGIRAATWDAQMTRPRVLLAEQSPAQQLKLERNLRRSGYSSDLAMDGSQAVRLASNTKPYGILLVSSLLRSDQLRQAAAEIRSREPEAVVLAYDASVPSPTEDQEARRVFLDECSHVFPYMPSYTGLMAILARFEVTSKMSAVPHSSHKEDFMQDILGVLERGKTA